MSDDHAPGRLDIPGDVDRLSGAARAPEAAVAIIVSRFNGEFTNRLLHSALEELDRADVPRDRITVLDVAGAFELPAAAAAMARSGRFACVVALGCVIRGETAHFEHVAGQAAAGLQLASVLTGVPVGFGVLTVDSGEQAAARVGAGGDAVRAALELSDAFRQLRLTE